MRPELEQNRDREGAAAATYLLTWNCYGSWLPGQPGAVSQARNQYGSPLPEPDQRTEVRSKNRMIDGPYVLDARRRQIVLQSLQEVCLYRRWTLWAAHVRTNHVHVVATANCRPEPAMNTLKSYCSRALNHYMNDGVERRRWARHGSTRYLWTGDAVRAAIQYVIYEQGASMAVFERTLLDSRGSAALTEPRP